MAAIVKSLFDSVSVGARSQRAMLFLVRMPLTPETRLLDLGSEDGSHIAAVLRGTPVRPQNVFIADIVPKRVEQGARRFGFTPVVVPPDGKLPFPDGFFDVVYCSSVIEHATVDKRLVWTLKDGRRFAELSRFNQARLAAEIRRIGRNYFVQTPYRWFPIESHTGLPFAGMLPRPLQVAGLRLSNRIWPKKSRPDWLLLGRRDMAELFPDGEILAERWLGLTKSLMAVRVPGKI